MSSNTQSPLFFTAPVNAAASTVLVTLLECFLRSLISAAIMIAFLVFTNTLFGDGYGIFSRWQHNDHAELAFTCATETLVELLVTQLLTDLLNESELIDGVPVERFGLKVCHSFRISFVHCSPLIYFELATSTCYNYRSLHVPVLPSPSGAPIPLILQLPLRLQSCTQ